MEGVELKDILGFIGVEGKDLEEIKSNFDSRFVTRENAVKDDEIRNKIHGQMFGGVNTAIKRTFRDGFGVELDKEEIEGKKYEEILSLGASKAKEAYETKISTLSEQVKASPKAEEIEAEWKGKYEKVLGEKSNFESLLNDTKTEFETFRTNIETEKKSSAINSKIESLVSGLDWSENTDKYRKTGFLAEMSKNYSLDLSDSGDLQIKKDGNLIPDPSKHGDFMRPEDIYKVAAIDAKLLKAPNAKSSTFVKPTVNNDGMPTNPRPNRATENRAF